MEDPEEESGSGGAGRMRLRSGPTSIFRRLLLRRNETVPGDGVASGQQAQAAPSSSSTTTASSQDDNTGCNPPNLPIASLVQQPPVDPVKVSDSLRVLVQRLVTLAQPKSVDPPPTLRAAANEPVDLGEFNP